MASLRMSYQCIEGGTDAASMVLFDPAALPAGFDADMKGDDPIGRIDQLAQVGSLFYVETHADGSYRLGVYVDDPLPDALQPSAKRLATSERFEVPSGRLIFSGVEYIFHQDDSFLQKYPQMGGSATVTLGAYRAEFFEFEYPEGFQEQVLRSRLPAHQWKTRVLMGTLAPIGCLGALLVLLSLFLVAQTPWGAIVLAGALLLVALPLILSRMPMYRQAQVEWKKVLAELPDYGVVLQRINTED